MKIINCLAIKEKIKEQLIEEIKMLKKHNVVPTLAIIQIGNNNASNIYIRNKINLSKELNTKTLLFHFDENVQIETIQLKIDELNKNSDINGILIQLPLPKQINAKQLVNRVNPKKDVDCFTFENIGKLWTAKNDSLVIKSCTPAGIIEILKKSNIELLGKHVVIISRSNIVGKPLAALFLLENSTVTICHSKSKNLQSLTKSADIIVVAVGKPKFLKKEHVKDGVVIVDVGINRDENNKICGDVDSDSLRNMDIHITPVPGGVGPLTVTMLLKNLIYLTKIQKNIK